MFRPEIWPPHTRSSTQEAEIAETIMRRNRSRKRTANVSAGQEEALTILHDEVFMQPWFIPKPVYMAIRRLLPNIHLMKLRHYFDDYGCIRCGKTDAIYGASGFCYACNVIVRSRILIGLKKRLKKAHVKWEQTAGEHFFDQMNLAQLILYGRTVRGPREADERITKTR
jgi:hypothetical protein